MVKKRLQMCRSKLTLVQMTRFAREKGAREFGTASGHMPATTL